MKIKLVIKDLNFLKKLKSDNNKNTSRNFSGTVVHSVGSFQCQIVPCSHLYLFSRSIDPLQCPVNVNYRVFICCTCYFQSGSLFFILTSFVCKSLQCLISTLTKRGERGHLFRLTSSVVLWGGRDTANKYRWQVWGVLTVYGPHWVCPSSWQHMLPSSTLLRLQDSLQGHCLKWALHFVPFPGLSNLGDQVIGECTFQVGHAS